MPVKQSAGILIYRYRNDLIEYCLAHPGGPFYRNKDDGSWTIFKGEFDETEDKLSAAKREFEEETSIKINGKFRSLTPVKIKSGKIIYAWAKELDVDVDEIRSNEFEMEWPPKSGKMQSFPEIDRAAWFEYTNALKKIHPGQLPLLMELATYLNAL